MALRQPPHPSAWASAMVGLWITACVSIACLVGDVPGTARASLRAISGTGDLSPQTLTRAWHPWIDMAGVVGVMLVVALLGGSTLYLVLARWERAQLPPLPGREPPTPMPRWQHALTATGSAIALAVVVATLVAAILAEPFAARDPRWGWIAPLAVIWTLSLVRALGATLAMMARRSTHLARHTTAQRDQRRHASRPARQTDQGAAYTTHERIRRIVLTPEGIELHGADACWRLPPHDLDAAIALARRDGAIVEHAAKATRPTASAER